MRTKRWAPLAASLLLAAGCFHQVVETGRPPGPTVVDKPWVATWLWGLIAADEIDVRKECPGGVAVVTTEQSFPNGLAYIFTLGIYAPQHVTITCASGGTASLPKGATELMLASNATAEQSAAVINRAVELSAKQHSPVVIRVQSTSSGEER